MNRFLKNKLHRTRMSSEWYLMQKGKSNKEEWFVYIVQCSDGTYYTGIAKDVYKRVLEHNLGKRGAKYTRSRLPVSLICFSIVNSRSEALKLELKVKSVKRSEKINYLKSYGVNSENN